MVLGIFKRSTLYLLGSGISKAATSFAWILLARALQPASYGTFTLFFLLIQTATFFFDCGLIQYFFKHVEAGKEEKVFGKLIYVRTIQLILSVILTGTLLFILKPFDQTTIVLTLASLVPMAYLSIGEGYYLEKKKPLRVSLKLGSIGAIFLVIFFFFSSSFSFRDSTVVFFISVVLTLLWFFPWHTLRHLSVVSEQEMVNIWKKSFPFAALTFISYVYNRADSFIIAGIIGPAALGLYGLAYRFLDALSMVPTSLSQNLFPVSAKKEGITRDALLLMSLTVGLAGLAVGLVLFMMSDIIILRLFGPSYAGSIVPLRIFSVVIVLMFINAPLATVVQSSRLLKRFLPFGIANTALNIILNLIFIPVFGIVAAAWMMIFSEGLGLVINLFFIRKLYRP